MVTLARQRGHSRISVHVHVKWRDVLFFPHKDRTCANYNVPHRRLYLPSPHLNRSWNAFGAAGGARGSGHVFALYGWHRDARLSSLTPSNSCPPGSRHASFRLSLCFSPMLCLAIGQRKHLLGVVSLRCFGQIYITLQQCGSWSWHPNASREYNIIIRDDGGGGPGSRVASFLSHRAIA